MNLNAEDGFFELSYYTLAHKTDEFIHQYIVDAFAAQTADANTKPIKIAFGLIGLYLHLEKGYSGRQVQIAHMQLAKFRSKLPLFDLPKDRGEITVFDVLETPEGEERDKKIEEWMCSVWDAYINSHKKVEEFLAAHLKS